jgi:hypothetical protein
MSTLLQMYIQIKNMLIFVREDKIELLQKLEINCRATDEAGKGKLTAEEFYKVAKIQVTQN